MSSDMCRHVKHNKPPPGRTQPARPRPMWGHVPQVLRCGIPHPRMGGHGHCSAHNSALLGPGALAGSVGGCRLHPRPGPTRLGLGVRGACPWLDSGLVCGWCANNPTPRSPPRNKRGHEAPGCLTSTPAGGVIVTLGLCSLDPAGFPPHTHMHSAAGVAQRAPSRTGRSGLYACIEAEQRPAHRPPTGLGQ